MDCPEAASWATLAVQYAMKSPTVPVDAETRAAYATEGGSAVNGPKVRVAVLDDVEGSPEGAAHAQVCRAYPFVPGVKTSVMDAIVVESVGATVSNAKYTVRAV